MKSAALIGKTLALWWGMDTKLTFPAAAIVALALSAAPAFAGQHQNRSRDRGDNEQHGTAVERGERRAPEPARQQPQQQQRAEPSRERRDPPAGSEGRAVERRDGERANQDRQARERLDRERIDRERLNRERLDRERADRDRLDRQRYDRRVFEPRTVIRGRVDPRWYDRGRYAPRTVIVVPSRRFYRPYYTFRPRYTIGFALFSGYPVAYPYYAPDPYAYPPSSYPLPGSTYPDPYGYPSSGSVAISPSTPAGGVSFDIRPADAAIYIDGEYIGVVGDFSPTMQPLTLVAGRHRIELRAPAFEPLVFDVDIVPGEVIPYQGTMRRY